MFVLLISLLTSPTEISTPEELAKLEINKRVQTESKVAEERTLYPNTKLLTLENQIEIIYEGTESLKEKNCSITGKVSEYNSKKQITAEKITLN